MTKESIMALQKIDCNCNDCKFMERDLERYEISKNLHYKWQLDYFNTYKEKLIEKAKWYKQNNNLEMFVMLNNESKKLTFQFNNKEASINYGNCIKLNKPVSFIPNTCQLDTQDCFKHRKE
jgi:hypothetical protein